MDIKTQVVNARLNGKTYSEITKEFGIAKSTAQGWVNNHGVPSKAQGFLHDNLQRDKPVKFKKNEDEILEFLEQLAPIKVSSEFNSRPSLASLNDYAVVGSDFHFGCQDQKSIDIFLETVRRIKPKTIVLNGDTMDFLAISKYPKDIKINWSLQKEREDYHTFLHDLISVCDGADIFETVSNHSGQSVDGRWRRYLSDRLGELSCLPEISETLSYENVFLGDYKDLVSHVDYVDLNGLIVTHGDIVRKHGGASPRGMIDKLYASVLHGHTHRIGSSCQRIPAIAGRKESQLYGFEGGCLCNLNQTYGTAMNWQNGFNIVSLGKDHGDFGVEQVLIKDGQANISTLGRTIKA